MSFDVLLAASEIHAEHEAAQRCASEAVAHAIRCGELLAEAKAALAHGAWASWVTANCPFSERTARAYRQLAALDPEDRQRVAALPLWGALDAIADPRRERPRLERLPRVPAPDIEIMLEEVAALLHKCIWRLDDRARIAFARRAMRMVASCATARDDDDRPLYAYPADALTREIALRAPVAVGA